MVDVSGISGCWEHRATLETISVFVAWDTGHHQDFLIM